MASNGKIVEVRYTGLAEALNDLSLEERAIIVYDSVCRNDPAGYKDISKNKYKEVEFIVRITDDLAPLISESVDYFCNNGDFVAAANLAIEAKQRDVAHAVFRRALRKEEADPIGASPSNLERYGDLARKMSNPTLANEIYSMMLPIVLGNIRCGLLAQYGYLDRLVYKAPELANDIIGGLVNHVGAISPAATYCRKIAEYEKKKGNDQLANSFTKRAEELDKAATP